MKFFKHKTKPFKIKIFNFKMPKVKSNKFSTKMISKVKKIIITIIKIPALKNGKIKLKYFNNKTMMKSEYLPLFYLNSEKNIKNSKSREKNSKVLKID
jgi:hypothetical protein